MFGWSEFFVNVLEAEIILKYGYPPDLQKKAMETVIKQVELMVQMELEF